jgi:hypothetical protein
MKYPATISTEWKDGHFDLHEAMPYRECAEEAAGAGRWANG